MVAQAISSTGSAISGNIAAGNAISTAMHSTMYGAAMGGIPGAPAPVRFCSWAAPEVTDIGNNAWGVAFQGAAIAISIANGLAQAQISEKQMDLAEGWYQQAKYKWDRFNNKYKPLEIFLLNEVSSVLVKIIDCDAARQRARTNVNTAYTGALGTFTRARSRYRLCIDPSLVSVLDFKQSMMLVDTENYNLDDERFFTDYKNDQRWNRRSNVLNLGRNLSSESLKYGQVANQLYSQLGAQLDRAAGGLIGALGYYGARNDTYYPTTYLGSNGSTNKGMLITTDYSSNVNPVAGLGQQ